MLLGVVCGPRPLCRDGDVDGWAPRFMSRCDDAWDVGDPHPPRDDASRPAWGNCRVRFPFCCNDSLPPDGDARGRDVDGCTCRGRLVVVVLLFWVSLVLSFEEGGECLGRKVGSVSMLYVVPSCMCTLAPPLEVSLLALLPLPFRFLVDDDGDDDDDDAAGTGGEILA